MRKFSNVYFNDYPYSDLVSKKTFDKMLLDPLEKQAKLERLIFANKFIS